MPTFMKELIDALAASFGGLKGYIIKKLLEWGGRYLLDLYYKMIRDKKQKEAMEKVDQDVELKKPRDEETRKNEQDFINS